MDAVAQRAISGDPEAFGELRALGAGVEALLANLPPLGPEEVLPPVISTLAIDTGHRQMFAKGGNDASLTCPYHGAQSLR